MNKTEGGRKKSLVSLSSLGESSCVKNKHKACGIMNKKCCSSTFDYYLDILRKNKGLLELNLKFPVRDINALSMVYTPGVAAPCLEIQKNINTSYFYTNRQNSMLLITDCSAMEKKENFSQSSAMVYLEAFCVYYKILANIDCYPIIFDSSRISNTAEFIETVFAISDAYSGVEFWGVNNNIIEDFKKAFESRKNKTFFWINTNSKRSLSQQYSCDISFIYAAVIRVLLDSQVYIDANDLVNEMLNNNAHIQKKLFDNKNHLKELSIYEKTLITITEAVKFIFANITFDQEEAEKDIPNSSNDNFKKFLSNTEGEKSKQMKKYFSINKSDYNINCLELSEDYIIMKYTSFISEGEQAWVSCLPNNYLYDKNTTNKNALLLHLRYRGVIQANTKLQIRDINQLNRILSFENLDKVADIINDNPEQAYKLTCLSNLGAIITNGTAILGLGDIGAVAGLPVMEGKSVLFKLYGGTDIIPICIQEKNEDKLISIIQRISPGLAIINLEDIKAPQCFKVEEALNSSLSYPVFHDDQHGTAVVTLAGLINATKLKGFQDKSAIKIVMNGAGAAGLSVTKLLMNYGFTNFIICDTEGAIYQGRPNNMNEFKNKLAELTNKNLEKGKLVDIIKGADVFIGLSVAGALTQDMVRSMNKDPIIFALANPIPEIFPDEAIAAGAFIVATGRSDFPNQINNSLAFPGIFRAAVDTNSGNITTEMKVAAAVGIASLVKSDELRRDFIMPASLDTKVSIAVTKSVCETSIKQGQARSSQTSVELVGENIENWFLEGRLINHEYIKDMNLKF